MFAGGYGVLVLTGQGQKTRATTTVLLGDDHLGGAGHTERSGAIEGDAQWKVIDHVNFDQISRSPAGSSDTAGRRRPACRRASGCAVPSRVHRHGRTCPNDAGISEILYVGLDLGCCCAAIRETGSVRTGSRATDDRIPTAFPCGVGDVVVGVKSQRHIEDTKEHRQNHSTDKRHLNDARTLLTDDSAFPVDYGRHFCTALPWSV